MHVIVISYFWIQSPPDREITEALVLIIDAIHCGALRNTRAGHVYVIIRHLIRATVKQRSKAVSFFSFILFCFVFSLELSHYDKM